MDLSKLPKLSQTERAEGTRDPSADPATPPGPAGEPPRTAEYVYAQSGTARSPVQVGGAAEAWISGLVGLVFLYLGQRFGGWLLATLTGRVYDHGIHAGDPATTPLVSYWAVDPRFFSAISDCALWVFGLALILEAAVLLMAGRRGKGLRPAVGATLVTTGLATLLNVAAIVYYLQKGFSLQLVHVVALAFGGYMCFYLSRVWKELRPA